MRIMDMPGPAPAFSLLASINFPVASLRVFWFRYLPGWWDDIVFVAAIGFFWYWVALNVYSWQQKRTVRIFSSIPLRLTVDLLLIAMGTLVGIYAVTDELRLLAFVHGVHGEALRNCFPNNWPGWAWFIAIAGLHLAWSVVLIFFFGRDFIHCVLRKKPVTINSV